MTAIIIEDEVLTAEDLKSIVQEVNPNIKVVALLQSVSESVRYFRENPQPDLIFSDIQLGDGLSFEIFSEVAITVPIVFCTAFDEYAIQAFKVNGIHYLLKPFNVSKVKEALDKYQALKNNFSNWSESIEKLLVSFPDQGNQDLQKVNSVLVYYKDSVIPIKIKSIAVFYIDGGYTHLQTFDGEKYIIEQTLNDLEKMTGSLFFRANRQFLINRKAVKKASSYLSRKINVELNFPFESSIIISKEKITSFLEWLKLEE